DIEDGEFVSFLAPRGSGKTTLLRIASAPIQPDRGEVVLDGRDSNDVPPDRRGIQACFQNSALLPPLTVAGNLRYGPAAHGCPKRTLLGIVSGLIQPDRGEGVVDGRVRNAVPPDRRGIQMCFQNYAVFPHLTGAGNIGYGPVVHGWPKRRIAERVEELLVLVQIGRAHV